MSDETVSFEENFEEPENDVFHISRPMTEKEAFFFNKGYCLPVLSVFTLALQHKEKLLLLRVAVIFCA